MTLIIRKLFFVQRNQNKKIMINLRFIYDNSRLKINACGACCFNFEAFLPFAKSG